MKKREYHGLSKTPGYWAWRSMIQRCTNPNFAEYEHYGGRGITVCDEWQNSYKAFFDYVGVRPKGMTLDRINNDGNYEPGNVQWATYQEQNRKRRQNKNNTTGIVGIIWDGVNNKWKAQISIDHRTINLGRFFHREDAIRRRQEAEEQYFTTTNTTRTIA